MYVCARRFLTSPVLRWSAWTKITHEIKTKSCFIPFSHSNPQQMTNSAFPNIVHSNINYWIFHIRSVHSIPDKHFMIVKAFDQFNRFHSGSLLWKFFKKQVEGLHGNFLALICSLENQKPPLHPTFSGIATWLTTGAKLNLQFAVASARCRRLRLEPFSEDRYSEIRLPVLYRYNFKGIKAKAKI